MEQNEQGELFNPRFTIGLHALQTSLDAAIRVLISKVDDNGKNVIIKLKTNGSSIYDICFTSHFDISL